MTGLGPTEGAIHAVVETVRRKAPGARAIGIRSAERWAGADRIGSGDSVVVVRQCDSPLALRLALREPEGDAAVRVFLTPLGEEDLGDDILLRLARQRLFPLDRWQIVQALFQAHAVDPRLTNDAWIADTLIEYTAGDPAPPVRAGFLDAETVWQLLLHRGLGLDAEEPDLRDLLEWSVRPENVRRLREVTPEFRTAAGRWLRECAGPAAEQVLRCAAAGDAPDAVPVGLVVGVVYHPEAAGRLEKAAGRMEERFLGGAPPPEEVLRRWSRTAAEVVQRLHTAGGSGARELLQRAEAILAEIGAGEGAHLSDILRSGFEQRLSALGRDLTAALAGKLPDPEGALRAALRRVEGHFFAQQDRPRLLRVEMALRLLRWLRSEGGATTVAPPSLVEAARYQAGEGSYLDWARQTLRAGDPQPALSGALGELFERVTDRREVQAREFARLLGDWTAAGSTGEGVLPVERILSVVVAPLAARRPVLILVMDGMTTAVCRELVADFSRRGWVPLRETAQPQAPRVGLATVPSVTEFSRASLVRGSLGPGDGKAEEAGFAAHPELVRHCRSGRPQLFHKAGLQEGRGASLAEEVRTAVACDRRRVIGVVVNAVDDHLARGDQTDIRWNGDSLPVVAALLQAAQDAKRLVVLVSDHGHVLEHRTRSAGPEAGERWRMSGAPPGEQELEIRGSRVVAGAGTLVAPWSERLRYGSAKKHGYHGGLSPQEMVVPIVVLAAGAAFPEGWQEAPSEQPAWWDAPAQAGPRPAPRAPKGPKAPPPGLLFDPDEAVSHPGAPAGSRDAPPEWIARLLASDVFRDQMKASRGSLGEADLTDLLSILSAHGDQLSLPALSRLTGHPPGRLRDLLTTAERVLNLDGFSVLHHDTTTQSVTLDTGTLLRHFNLS